MDSVHFVFPTSQAVRPCQCLHLCQECRHCHRLCLLYQESHHCRRRGLHCCSAHRHQCHHQDYFLFHHCPNHCPCLYHLCLLRRHCRRHYHHLCISQACSMEKHLCRIFHHCRHLDLPSFSFHLHQYHRHSRFSFHLRQCHRACFCMFPNCCNNLLRSLHLI